jgi:membrane fusion protein, multidrug efflux system
MNTKRTVLIVIGALLLIGGGLYFYTGKQGEAPAPDQKKEGRRGPDDGKRAVPVMAATAQRGDIDVVINGLGTVTALNTAAVKSRVDGLLVSVPFREGQMVKKGDVLAEIDPRPFQAALDQAAGQLARDEALLSIAKIDLDRYRGLLAKDSIARQQVDDQEALVRQDEGIVLNDRGMVDNARLNLAFTHITAPIPGRLGLRLLDAGNMIHASDATGLVVITQTQPIYVVFSIPSDNLAQILPHYRAGRTLTVEAYDRDNKVKLATGKLLTVDNQIDVATGTVKLKAEFANAGNELFPNQFTNARLHVEKRSDSVLVPISAIQRGATQGTFVYVIGDNQAVSIRPVTLGTSLDNVVAIEKGLKAGERVVIDGADKLRDGSPVEIVRPEGKQGKGGGRGDHKGESGGDSQPQSAPPETAEKHRHREPQ